MTNQAQSVRAHYQAAIDSSEALLARVGEMVDAMELPIDARRLASLDQFHLGGLAATKALAERVGVTSDLRVLDAGSGLGGPARYLAETFGCHVDGVDLSPDYVALATMLTERAGLSAQVTFREGDLTQLPFELRGYDLVWTQHVAINIADRAGLYRELRRALKPGGRLAFYDPVAVADHPDLFYPVPWAESAATSALLTEDQTREVLEAAGLSVTRFEDVTAEAMGWAQVQGALGQAAAPNLSMIVGPRMAEMAGNFMRNLREDRVRLLVGVADAS